MSKLFTSIGIIGAGFAGYMFEPELRPILTGQRKTISSGESSSSMSSLINRYDYSQLQPSQLPKSILLRAEVDCFSSEEKIAVKIGAGTKVTPLRIENRDVVISVANLEGRVPVLKTDLVEQLLDRPPAAIIIEKEIIKEVKEEVKQTETEPTNTNNQIPVADITLSAEEIVALIQENIRSAKIKEFTFEKVTDWKAGDESEIDGVKYQSGDITYKSETIFGVKNIQARALIQGGKVARWIWPSSGLEIQ
jgi:hypothetical protein